jgi:hydrogenase nickel incorporation protein HypA/HybF
MHEFSIMESALSMASEQARQAGATRVHLLRLRVGALSGAVPEALQFAFEALSPGTLMEGAELGIEEVPAKFYCRNCSAEFTADRMYSECPNCQQASGEIRAGRELELASMEIE